MKWPYLSFVGFILSLITCILLLLFGSTLSGPDRAIVYLLILIPVAIGSSLLLFKTLRTNASINGKFGAYKLHLSGPAAIFFLVICVGYQFIHHPPEQGSINLEIVFEDSSNEDIRPSGKAVVTFRSRDEEIPVTNGIALLSDVQAGFDIKVVPVIQGFLKNPIVEKITNDTIRVKLSKDTVYVANKFRIESQFINIIKSYLSSATDFSQGLNDKIDRILHFDPSATEDEINFSNQYAAAYNKLNGLTDSILYLLNQQSPDLAKKSQELKEKAIDFHRTYFLANYNNRILRKINDYILKGKNDHNKSESIRDDVNDFNTKTAGAIIELDRLIKAISEQINPRQ